MKKMIPFLLLVLAVSVTTAQLGYNDPTLPKIEAPSSSVVTEVVTMVNATNYSDFWITNVGDLDNVNSTQFENNGGTLSIITSWLSSFVSSLGYVPYTGATGNVNLGANNLSLNESIIIDSDSNGLIVGTEGTAYVRAGVYSGTADNIVLGSTKAGLGTVVQSSATNFRLVANSVAGQGFFQVGATGGSNAGNLYFSGYNAARANAVTFFGRYNRIADSGLTVGTLIGLAIEYHLWLERDNDYIYLGAGKDSTFSYNGTDLLINPDLVGTGKAIVQGDLLAEDYYSADGSTGGTSIIDVLGADSVPCQITYKNGLYISTDCPTS